MRPLLLALALAACDSPGRRCVAVDGVWYCSPCSGAHAPCRAGKPLAR